VQQPTRDTIFWCAPNSFICIISRRNSSFCSEVESSKRKQQNNAIGEVFLDKTPLMQTKTKTTFMLSELIRKTIAGLLLQAYMTQCLQFELRFTIQCVLLSQLASGRGEGWGKGGLLVDIL